LGDPDSPVFPTYWPIRTNHLAHICFVFLFSSQNSKLRNVPVPLAPYLSTHMVSPCTISYTQTVHVFQHEPATAVSIVLFNRM